MAQLLRTPQWCRDRAREHRIEAGRYYAERERLNKALHSLPKDPTLLNNNPLREEMRENMTSAWFNTAIYERRHINYAKQYEDEALGLRPKRTSEQHIWELDSIETKRAKQ